MLEAPQDEVLRLVRNKQILDSVVLAQAKVLLERSRTSRPDIWSEPTPLVTVRICTFNRPALLVERAIASVLRQTYTNFELLIIGDHASPETGIALSRIKDPRVRYVNLPERPKYPKFPRFFWSSAGAYPAYLAYDLARGDWMTFLDDDDEYTDDHIEVLLTEARRHRYEFVYGVMAAEGKNGTWSRIGTGHLARGKICSGSVLFSRRLFGVRADPFCWIYDEPGDWLVWSQMAQIGAHMGFVDHIVGKHYLEYSMIDESERQMLFERRATPEEFLADLEHCGGMHLMNLA